MSEELIAQNIRRLRTKRKLTLQQLSNLTGLTRSYISKLERSKKAPPYSTLNRVARALGVDVSYLLNQNGEALEDVRIAFVKNNQGKNVESTSSGYTYQTLASGKPGKNMEPYIIEAAFEEKAIFQHEGEEFLYVLEGTHEFIYDGKKYLMEKGDSVYFDSGVPHTGWSVGKKKAKLLAVMFSYKRI
ncbi:MAG: helix-turn-helix domain-containing protein [Desulfomonilaceae bacterium]